MGKMSQYTAIPPDVKRNVEGRDSIDGCPCCWLCGKNGSGDPLDKHHIFGGPFRNKSQKYGLIVFLCHFSCHIFGEKSAHSNKETRQMLQAYGQRKAMTEQSWTTERFIKEFGRSYL